MWIRVLIFLALLASSLFLNWWITTSIVLVYLFLFNAYEVIFFGLVLDSLYATSVPVFFGIEFIFTILFSTLFVLTYFLKKKLIYYPAM